MLLAAIALCVGFTACNDDEKEPTPQKPDTPEVVDFPDYSSAIDLNLNAMLQKYGEPAMAFGGYYMYMYDEGNVLGLTFIVNEENNKVYSVNEVLNDSVYTEEEIQAYFGAKYKLYRREKTEAYEDEDLYIPAQTVYIYGNTEKEEDATLVITVTGNSSVSYVNPQNVPEEVEPTANLDEMTPMEVVNTFYGKDIDDILDEYEGLFMEMNGVYMTVIEDNEYLSGFALVANDGVVNEISIFYNDGMEEETLFSYYQENGYTVTATGEEDEDGFKPYTITNGVVTIVYQGYIGTVTVNLDEED